MSRQEDFCASPTPFPDSCGQDLSSWAMAMQEIVLLNRAGMKVGTHLYFEMEREREGAGWVRISKRLEGARTTHL